MNQSWLKSIFVFCGIGCLSAFPAAAFAGVGDPIPGLEEGAEVESSLSEVLPTQLDSWGDDAREVGDFSILTISALPQGRLATQPPFFDFNKFELGGFVGAVHFSSDFKANTNIVGGIEARVPVPGLPGHFGIWGDLYAGGISRDLPFFYPHQSGTWFGGTIGVDYTFLDGEIFDFRGQAGLSYAYWNGVQSLDNGFGATVGVDLAWYWIKHYRKASVNITPQITFSGSNYYAFITLGFQVEF
jgi:hypothetical protein